MEPQGRGNVPARHTPERNKRLGLRKTTLESRGHVQTSWAECPRQKKFRHRAEGEIFLLTFPFIGLFRHREASMRSATPAILLPANPHCCRDARRTLLSGRSARS